MMLKPGHPSAEFAMVLTPPAEDGNFDLSPLKDDLEKMSSERQTKMSPPDPSLSRIYRYTPTPTIILDPSWCIVEVSNSHLAVSGMSRDSLLGTCICDLAPSAIPAPDIATLYGGLRAAMATKEVQIIENVHQKLSKPHGRLHVVPIFEESELIYVMLETHNAPTDQLGATDNQHAYINETYKILVDTVKDYAIFMLDTSGNIVTWNSGAAILKGYTAAEIIGRHFSLFYSPEDRLAGKPGRGLAVCLRDGKMEDEGWRYRRDGSCFWANVMITPIFEFGRHVGFVKVTRDLSERKQAEARMIAAFEESSKMKTEFLANMSHEIRTPMNGMFLALNMLTGTELNEEQREFAAIMQDSSSILLQVINDVLDYSKLSSGSFSVSADVLNVKSVVDAVVRNCRSGLTPRVELSSSMPSEFPLLQGDPLRFRQVLQNLVGNAVKFTDVGYIKISTSFTVDEDPQMYNILIEVTDSGIGVPDSAINTLFTPFMRLADATRRRYQGTGLGLSICKSLAELMNGAVGFRPNPEGHGSTFWFTTQMKHIDMTASGKLASPRTSPKVEDVSEAVRKIAPHKHILLVEDNMVNHVVMLKLLQSLGFERVDGAWNGAEAVRMVTQTPLSFDAVLMDISMPVMDGLEATSEIRKMNADVPIIALTGNALKGDAETYLATGMNDFIGKPVHRNDLLRTLLRWIGT